MIVFLLSIWNCIPDQCFLEADISEKIEEWIFDASSLSERKNETLILNSSLHSIPKFSSNYKLPKEFVRIEWVVRQTKRLKYSMGTTSCSLCYLLWKQFSFINHSQYDCMFHNNLWTQHQVIEILLYEDG